MRQLESGLIWAQKGKRIKVCLIHCSLESQPPVAEEDAES